MILTPFVKTVERAALLPGESISIGSPNAKNYNSIFFEGNIETLGSLTVSHGTRSPWCSAYLVIDSATVSVYEYPGEEVLAASYVHGLDLQGHVRIQIRTAGGFSATLELTSPSGSFRQEILWNGSHDDIRVEATESVITDCRLRYCIEGLGQDIWMFGGSYFDFWPRQLVAEGCSDFYLDGYSGRDSANALLSLKICLQYATPKMIVWFMGMNDPDEAAISRSWETAYCTLTELCHRYGITLVLSTVPNVPERSHRYKNNLIRSSGFATSTFAARWALRIPMRGSRDC